MRTIPQQQRRHVFVPQLPSRAVQEARKRLAKRRDARQQLTQAIVSSHEPLYAARTAFPFTLFPDTVVIDRAKLTVTRRNLFWTTEAMSIRIEDVLNVTADVGPLFGSVKIATRFFTAERQPYIVNYLWRKDALKIKRIMQGYIIATQKEIDCAELDTHQLAELLDELGDGSLNNANA